MSKTRFTIRCSQLQALIEGENDLIANLANTSALLNLALEDLNWVGFYLLKSPDEGSGTVPGNLLVCAFRLAKGSAVRPLPRVRRNVSRMVHAFAGHIACDGASNSEIVLPIFDQGRVVAVLDIDSPSLARFDAWRTKSAWSELRQRWKNCAGMGNVLVIECAAFIIGSWI